MTSRVVAQHLSNQESQVNSEDQRNWEQSRQSISAVGTHVNSPMRLSIDKPPLLSNSTTPVVNSNLATQATPNNVAVTGDYVKFDSPRKAQQLPEAMNYILPT